MITFDSLSLSWSALGTAVLQFLWQGALIGALAASVLGCMRSQSAERRYFVASAALFACLVVSATNFVGTVAHLERTSGGAALVARGLDPNADVALRTTLTTSAAAWVWSIGVAALAARFVFQCAAARRLKTTLVGDVDAAWQAAFERLKHELGVRADVRLIKSGLAQVPMVAGWLSPVVLVPAAAFTGLSPDQLRSLLAHELAHIRRHDHWLNALQAVVEIILFFHPVVWWISRQVRIEREYCCDDSSVRVTGNPRLLAGALASMEELRLQQPMTRSTLAANGGPLMQRITRILGVRADGRTSLIQWQLPAVFVLAGVMAFAGSAYAAPSMLGEHEQKVRPERADVGEQRTEEKVWAKLKAEVEAGKLTLKQAEERFERFKRESFERRRKVRISRQIKEIKEAVASGDLTEADAHAKMSKIMQSAQRDAEHASLEGVRQRIQGAVEQGKLTPEQGQARFEEYKQKLLAEQREIEQALAQAQRHVKQAIDAGKLSPEEGRAKLEQLTRKLKERSREVRVRKQKPSAEEQIREIQAAVESGSMTPADGRKKVEAIKQALEERTRRRSAMEKAELEMKMLHDGVKAGRIAPEEAKRKMEEIRKRLAPKHGSPSKGGK